MVFIQCNFYIVFIKLGLGEYQNYVLVFNARPSCSVDWFLFFSLCHTFKASTSSAVIENVIV